jgi:hypothetical protein
VTAAGLPLVLLLVLLAPLGATARVPLSDGPVVWYANDDLPCAVPAFAEPELMLYSLESFLGRPFSRFWHPGRLVRKVGTGDAARTAGNINALDEVVNSTWFTNRIGLRPLSEAELREGPSRDTLYREGPDRSAPWMIIGAKTAGVTPGFRIQDARGDTWLLKFDPPTHPGMTIRSGVVANLIFHAIGFNTPVDQVVVFDRDQLVVGEGAEMKAGRFGTVVMSEANLDSILASTGSIFDGHFHALASRYLDGIALGPFDDQDTRADDPNDRIKHENRRELRGLRVFAAWLNHFDSKMHNSLDMYEGDPGQGYVRHYLIDFASTLGAFGDQMVRRFGYEYGLDAGPILGRMLTLGLVEDTWVSLERPAGLSEVGLFDVATFEPQKWKPDLPHSAMANLTARDGYWAAKIVSAFSDADLRPLVEQGRYQNPAAVDFLVQALADRRDKIARYWFAQVPPLDYFRQVDGQVAFDDLAVARGYVAAGTSSYRYRLAVVDSERRTQEQSAWQESAVTVVPISRMTGDDRYRFLGVEVQVQRGDGWSASTTAYFRLADGGIVAVDR